MKRFTIVPQHNTRLEIYLGSLLLFHAVLPGDADLFQHRRAPDAQITVHLAEGQLVLLENL